MTCVVSVLFGDEVYMGSDSAGITGNWDLRIREDKKVFQIKDMIIGFTTSFRMGQLLQYSLNVPDYPYEGNTEDEINKYMHCHFLEAVRELFKSKGYSKIENNSEEGGEFLIGYRNKLWIIHSDYQIARSYLKYQAIGCGAPYALGTLHMIRDGWDNENAWLCTPGDIIHRALYTAEQFCAGVRGPYYILKLIGG